MVAVGGGRAEAQSRADGQSTQGRSQMRIGRREADEQRAVGIAWGSDHARGLALMGKFDLDLEARDGKRWFNGQSSTLWQTSEGAE